MRWLSVLGVAQVAVLLLAGSAPSALAGHVGQFPHVNPLTVNLPPGGTETVDLVFPEAEETPEGAPEGSFAADWAFVLNARVGPGSGPVNITLRQGHASSPGPEVITWAVQEPQTRLFSANLPANGLYSFLIKNPNPDKNATVTFVYDQACNCAAKPIPVEMEGLMVVFNADVKKGSTWKATIPEPPVHTLEVSLAKRVNERSRWPEDFQVLQLSTTPQPQPDGPAHVFTWTADEDTRYYFFTKSVSMNLSRFDRSDPASSVMVVPSYEQLSAAPTPKATPLGLAPLAAASGLALLLARRRP